jgi:inorganic triphosphatase YgiF
MEREAKFPVPDPATWQRLAQATRVAGTDQVSLGREQQVNLYFDTEDGALARERFACRVRAVGDRRIVCVKGPLEPRKDVVVRYELERMLPPGELAQGGAPSRDLVLELMPPEVRDRLGSLAPLIMILKSGTDRRRFTLRRAGVDVAEMVLDDVSFTAGTRELPVYRELEVELTGGDEGELARLVRWFREEWGLVTSTRSKLEVGLELTGRRWPPA